jgi:hypothetical protein
LAAVARVRLIGLGSDKRKDRYGPQRKDNVARNASQGIGVSNGEAEAAWPWGEDLGDDNRKT